ncbi:MAG: endonuclease III domain-containing protein [Pseudomonadota bacterium]
MNTGHHLMEMVDLLLSHFGPQHWWPGETPLEVMVGAILTQNTNWNNVEKAIQNLKRKGLLSVHGLHSVTVQQLAEEIRPAGYFNIKSKRLKNLIHFLVECYEGKMALFLEDRTETLRNGLLSVKGIGPETADSILLYAVKRPLFVVDNYTYRILNRHGLVDDPVSYDDLQDLFMSNLPHDPQLFNEFHALIVCTGKNYCRKKPLCHPCPLNDWGPAKPLARINE